MSSFFNSEIFAKAQIYTMLVEQVLNCLLLRLAAEDMLHVASHQAAFEACRAQNGVNQFRDHERC